MAEPFLSEIRLFATNAIPDGWLLCDGRYLEKKIHENLFALLGTTYGGEGVIGFQIPDLRGRVAVGQGEVGSRDYVLGLYGGKEKNHLTKENMPRHTHKVLTSSETADQSIPKGHVLANSSENTFIAQEPDEAMMAGCISTTGAGEPMENRMPYLAMSYCIAIVGAKPPHS